MRKVGGRSPDPPRLPLTFYFPPGPECRSREKKRGGRGPRKKKKFKAQGRLKRERGVADLLLPCGWKTKGKKDRL